MHMSKRLKLKLAILVGIVVVGMLGMGVWIAAKQTNLAVQDYTQEMQQEAQALPELLSQAQDETQQNTSNFDAIYQSKAESVAFMANAGAGYEATNSKMQEYLDLLDVDNIMIVSRQGSVVAAAQSTQANFTDARFSALFSVFTAGEAQGQAQGEASDAVEVETAGQTKRYYSAKIDDTTMVVVEQSPEELTQLIEDSGSLESVLKNITIGQNGYMFAISAADYTISYHPNEALEGTDALACGFKESNLQDGTFCWVKFNGENTYCNVSEIDGTYYVSAVPEATFPQLAALLPALFCLCFWQ